MTVFGPDWPMKSCVGSKLLIGKWRRGGGFEHDPQQSGLQLADSTLPRWLSMPRLPWLLGPYWPMARIRIPVSYAAVVGLNQPASWPCRAVYPPCCSSIPLIAPRSRRDERQFAFGGGHKQCMRKHNGLLSIARALGSSGLFECTHGCMARGGPRSAQSLHKSGFPETGFASENSKPSAHHQSVSAGSSEIDSNHRPFAPEIKTRCVCSSFYRWPSAVMSAV